MIAFLSNAMASFIQISALLLLFIMCYRIVGPFISIVTWGMWLLVLAFFRPTRVCRPNSGGREKWSAAVLVGIGLVIVIAPVWLTAESSIHSAQALSADFKAGTVSIPPPGDGVAEWPLIGESIHTLWSSAAENLESTDEYLRSSAESHLGQSLASFAGGMILGALQFVLSLFIAGALLLNAEAGRRVATNVLSSLMGDETGTKMTGLSILTIRSIVKGVLGIAIIQAVLRRHWTGRYGRPRGWLVGAGRTGRSHYSITALARTGTDLCLGFLGRRTRSGDHLRGVHADCQYCRHVPETDAARPWCGYADARHSVWCDRRCDDNGYPRLVSWRGDSRSGL